MQFLGNFKGKPPILSKFYAQGPPGVKSPLGPPDQNLGSAPALGNRFREASLPCVGSWPSFRYGRGRLLLHSSPGGTVCGLLLHAWALSQTKISDFCLSPQTQIGLRPITYHVILLIPKLQNSAMH